MGKWLDEPMSVLDVSFEMERFYTSTRAQALAFPFTNMHHCKMEWVNAVIEFSRTHYVVTKNQYSSSRDFSKRLSQWKKK